MLILAKDIPRRCNTNISEEYSAQIVTWNSRITQIERIRSPARQKEKEIHDRELEFLGNNPTLCPHLRPRWLCLPQSHGTLLPWLWRNPSSCRIKPWTSHRIFPLSSSGHLSATSPAYPLPGHSASSTDEETEEKDHRSVTYGPSHACAHVASRSLSDREYSIVPGI